MSYKLYISDGCPTCERVITMMESQNLAFTVINLSRPDAPRPEKVIVVPALFKGDKLLAYGADIPEKIN